jgi:hypothetical protein
LEVKRRFWLRRVLHDLTLRVLRDVLQTPGRKNATAFALLARLSTNQRVVSLVSCHNVGAVAHPGALAFLPFQTAD